VAGSSPIVLRPRDVVPHRRETRRALKDFALLRENGTPKKIADVRNHSKVRRLGGNPRNVPWASQDGSRLALEAQLWR
jgi:hypothetical protein